MTKEEVLIKLYNHVNRFINAQQISCAETIQQCDRVIENAYDFIETCCDIVGYVPENEED